MKEKAFISGACGGLGRALAVECARRGFDLFLTDLDGGRLAGFARSLSFAYGVRADVLACDMADFDARTRLVESLQEKGMRFTLLLNVAGVDLEGPFLENERQAISKVVIVNLLSPLDMIRSLVPLREPGRPFRVLNVCSMAGLFPMPVKAVYAATKRALIDMTLALREELKPLGVTLTALCPAGLATNDVLVKNMSVQGVMGALTTLQLGTVASSAVDRALRGAAVYVPGFFNRFVVAISRIVPRSLVCRFIHRRWQRTHWAFRRALESQDRPVDYLEKPN